MPNHVVVSATRAAQTALTLSAALFFADLAIKAYYSVPISGNWVAIRLLTALEILALAFPVIWLYRIGKGLDRPGGQVNLFFIWASVLFIPVLLGIVISASVSIPKSNPVTGEFNPARAVPVSDGEFEDCILKNMPGVANDAAALSIQRDCFIQHPKLPNAIPEKRTGFFDYRSGTECVAKKGRDTVSQRGGRLIVMACQALYM